MTPVADSGSAREICELQVTLLDVDPPVWRRVAVARTVTLADLHRVIQTVMGWANVHLHQFVTADGVRYEANDTETDPDALDPGVRDARGVPLWEVLPHPGVALRYAYDFGDGWQHRVELLAVRPFGPRERPPQCLAGERACPPEDCGGPWGYAELRGALTDPSHERHAELAEWLSAGFDPDAFDLEATNARLHALR